MNGYSRPEFSGLKTTLVGVEQMWHERDWALVRSGIPLGEAFDAQVQKIGETLDKRWSIARGIARCAGWLDDDVSGRREAGPDDGIGVPEARMGP
jgi:hypothetical protein